MHDAVSAAWDKLTEDWPNQGRHDALLQLAVEHNEFQWVASKYKERKGDELADAQLVKLRNAAMVMMLAAGTAQREREKAAASPYKRALLWILVLAVMLVFGLIAAKLMANAHHGKPR